MMTASQWIREEDNGISVKKMFLHTILGEKIRDVYPFTVNVDEGKLNI